MSANGHVRTFATTACSPLRPTEMLRDAYSDIAAGLILRSQAKQGAQIDDAVSDAASLFTNFMMMNVLTIIFFARIGSSGMSKTEFALSALAAYAIVDKTNRFLIRRWVLDQAGQVKPGLGGANCLRRKFYPYVAISIVLIFASILVRAKM